MSMAVPAPVVDRFEIGALQLAGLDAVGSLLLAEISGIDRSLVERKPLGIVGVDLSVLFVPVLITNTTTYNIILSTRAVDGRHLFMQVVRCHDSNRGTLEFCGRGEGGTEEQENDREHIKEMRHAADMHSSARHTTNVSGIEEVNRGYDGPCDANEEWALTRGWLNM